MSLTLIELLKKYSETFPVSSYRLGLLDEDPQDIGIKEKEIVSGALAEKNRSNPCEIVSVRDCDSFDRSTTYFSYFLDGCRKAYYICDIATRGGGMVPILVGQISSAVLKRNRNDGKVSVHKYDRKSLFLLPVGGGGINEGDANEIKRIVEDSFRDHDQLSVVFVTQRNTDNPQNDSLAKINYEMQNLEIKFLHEMTNANDLGQTNMVVVDGALQFQNIRKEKISNLRYAVGLAKHFNLHLTHIIGRTKEIGTLLTQLKEVGDRTPAYRLKMDNGTQFAFWYLRIRPRKYLNFPFAGIVKVEKALVLQNEIEDGLETDIIDNISRCLLLEISVCPYGNDFRWASHIYPIYLTEQIQKKRFVNDHYFEHILRRRLL